MLTPVTTDKDVTRRRKVLEIAVTPSGVYTPGGDTLDFTTTTNPKFFSNGKVAAMPKSYNVLNCPAGYTAELIAGTTLKNWKLKVFSAAGQELGAAAYPAALLADPIKIRLSGPMGAF